MKTSPTGWPCVGVAVPWVSGTGDATATGTSAVAVGVDATGATSGGDEECDRGGGEQPPASVRIVSTITGA